MRKVACLYRVSTKGQVQKDDIPMQREACRAFVAKQDGWEIVEEYYEKGVSGYKVKLEKRDALIKARNDAEEGKFDVLLVYMFDRLGRREDETPFVVKGFHDLGVEIWSATEGQQRFDNHVDTLMNFIRFWQSSGESQKTSQRVKTKMSQMALEGKFTGGSVPFGYKLVGSGELNNDGKELMKPVIDPVDSEIVKLIFNLSARKGYGANRITKYLNSEGIKTSKGVTWSSSTIGHMLRNSFYVGLPTYNTGGEVVVPEEPVEELILIDQDTWNRSNELREARTSKSQNGEFKSKPTSSPLLLTGKAKCGHCGSPLTSTHNYKNWTTKDGQKKHRKVIKYRCSGKSLNRVECDGQTIYSKIRVEETVLEEIKGYLKYISGIDLDSAVDNEVAEALKEINEKYKAMKAREEKLKKEAVKLNEEIVKSITGDSHFSPKVLSELIEAKGNELRECSTEVLRLKEEFDNKSLDSRDLYELKVAAPDWGEVFDKAGVGEKKMMLYTILDHVEVYRDKIVIHLNVHIKAFLDSVHGVAKQDNELSRIGGNYNPLLQYTIERVGF